MNLLLLLLLLVVVVVVVVLVLIVVFHSLTLLGFSSFICFHQILKKQTNNTKTITKKEKSK